MMIIQIKDFFRGAGVKWGGRVGVQGKERGWQGIQTSNSHK